MEKQKLYELLQELHSELEQADAVDEKTGQLLESLKSDISKLVQEESSLEDGQEDLSQNLSQALSHFEEEHPRLSMAIQYVLDSLARMGF
ncbi:DUF4404 family protein [Prosthecochloris sp. HL-130-GSB]|jgi:ABC-type transporter Mla subunit MlaD|uniref:DUF4404 family protein n=1 Tax=Prosthecochloris sp. HL-130-GSB TaxID=1974213 RepID=UPI000A1C1717|nr:DUF4404 family protein [Prosthecochloris sp. HL-130-GSB]ARM30465.1 hypothetical protein B9H02_02880 [Prosthecochloris sp. HL-130-GSB]